MANNKDSKKDRRDEAKRARLEAQKRAARAARMRKVYGGLVALVAVALIVYLVANSGKAGKKAKQELVAAATAAGCDAPKGIPTLESPHIAVGASHAPYNSKPPTSGPHYNQPPQGPLPTGVHATEVADEGYVHNMEHGHIGVEYTSALPQAVRDALEEWTKEHATVVLMAPRQDQPQTLAFTAWGQLMACNSPTNPDAVAKAAELFRKAYQNHAPETVPGTPIA